MSRYAVIGTGAALAFGAAVGLATYAEDVNKAEQFNVGYRATDKVVACAELLGQKTLDIAEVKLTCPTESFSVTDQNAGSDGTHTVTVKYPTPSDYLEIAYGPAKELDQAELSRNRWRSLGDVFVFGGAGTLLAASSIAIAGLMRKRDEGVLAESVKSSDTSS